MAKTSLGTSTFAPDTSLTDAVGNIAAIFDPKTIAAAELQKAHSAYYEDAGKAAAAKAAMSSDQMAAMNALNDPRFYSSDASGRTVLNQLTLPEYNALAIRAGGGSSEAPIKSLAYGTGVANVFRNPYDPGSLVATGNAGAVDNIMKSGTIVAPAGSSVVGYDPQTRTASSLFTAPVANETTVIPQGGTLVNRSTGETVATGAPKPVSTVTQLRNKNALADLVAGHLGGVRDKTTGAIKIDDGSGTLKPLAIEQSNALINRVAELGATSENVSDAVVQAAQELGFNLGETETNRSEKGSISNLWRGKNLGVKFLQSPVNKAPVASAPVVAAPVAQVAQPAVNTSAQPQAAITSMPDPKSLKAGQIYNTPKGPLKWTGTGFISP